MADTPLPASPLPADPAAFRGVTISAAPPLERWSLRGRDRAVLEGVIARKLPERIGEVRDGAVCLGPDEWLLRAPAGARIGDGAGAACAVVDISHRAVAIALAGPAAAEVIAAGCPRDIARFALGYATRTVFEGVEVIVERTGDQAFTLEVWRSFAPWLWAGLAQVAADLEFTPA